MHVPFDASVDVTDVRCNVGYKFSLLEERGVLAINKTAG
jgi:hypothetical protein